MSKPTDTEMLDWLETQVEGYGAGIVVRPSIFGRGFRLHEIGEDWRCITKRVPQRTVRKAIAHAIETEEE